MAWYSLPLPKLEQELATNFRSGLTSAEASARLTSRGPNELPLGKPKGWGVIFVQQFRSSLIYLLLAAAVFMLATHEYIDAGIVAVVLLFNSIVGTIQEGKAQNTLAALKKFVKTEAFVMRDGKEFIIPDREVVPGDVLILQEGQRIPADARIVESNTLQLDEAAITGESLPVLKQEKTMAESVTNPAEQVNMVFKGTYVTTGNGRAVVVATGVETFIGKISQSVAGLDTESPLQGRVRNLSRLVLMFVAVSSIFLFILGISLGNSVTQMLETIIALAVSIVPEGLPIVLTLVLAGGVWRMAKRNALVKKLQAVEALGQARIIAVDKTGTLTRNEMIVRRVLVGQAVFEIGGNGYESEGAIMKDSSAVEPANHPELLLLGKIAALASSAQTSYSEQEQRWRVAGDPTEAAMSVLAQKVGFKKEELIQEMPQVAEIPFDYRTKYHAVVHENDQGHFLALAGAPESVLDLSASIYVEGKQIPLTKAHIEKIQETIRQFSHKGLRVVAAAYSQRHAPKEHGDPGSPETFDVRNLTFMGLFGMQDALRAEVPSAMAAAREAGIKVVMITGDHKLTAEAIARDAGIFQDGDLVLTDKELSELSDKELDSALAKTTVFARITPDHKMKIIQAYRRRGEIVAMTGDGVNDAPSLVAADLGVAMGKTGTEVTKEAADIVLLDDNFGTIVAAVEEGRAIYRTIKKVILYLFSTSMGEFLAIAGALLMGFPLPVLPGQILWLNLVTDGFLTVALAMEPKDQGILKEKFKSSEKNLVDWLMGARIFVMAVPMMIGALYLFSKYYQENLTLATTVALTVLAVFQWLNAWNCRSQDKSIFQMNPFSNKWLIGAAAIVIGLQLMAVYAPFMHTVLRTTPLAAQHWIEIGIVSLLILFAEEGRKLIVRVAR